ncbi:MAG TPA: hypothetical protein VD996_17815, partial [Chitinophagaceae bacterium]|nr:hypothetical protein [Chitinophagaceae bacterium]
MPSPTGILLTGESKWYKVILRFISFLFKSIWLFFPAILFIVLGIWCFWTLGQGKDVIVAFAENPRAKIYFFLAIALWAYVSWFSSRIVAYQKRYKQLQRVVKITGSTSAVDTEQEQQSFNYELPVLWLEMFPRILGFACFLAVEMAILQLKFYGAPDLPAVWAWILFSAILLAYLVFNDNLSAFADRRRIFTRRLFYILLAAFIAFAVVTWVTDVQHLVVLFCAVVLLHLVYVIYIHLRRSEIKNEEAKQRAMTRKVAEEKPGPL